MAAGARWVRIDEAAIPAYVAALPLELVPAQLDPEFHYYGGEADTATFVVTLDAINFGSGLFPHLRRRDRCSGYLHVARALKERFEERGPYSAVELAAISPEECAEVFDQPGEGPAFQLMTMFARALRALGSALQQDHGGSVPRLIQAAGGSAERLAGLLAAIPCWDDVHRWRGLEVPIYKRAQITPADLSLALGGRGLGHFTDLERLTLFADNLVPHVLRLDGILLFDPHFAGRIERGEPLESGSEEEVELRACAVHAVEQIWSELARRGHRVRPMDLDNLLWNRGQDPRYKSRPRPRCVCFYY